MKKIYYPLLITVLFASCTTVKDVPPHKRDYVDVPLNAPLDTEIGETIVEKGTELYQEALKIEKINSFSISFVKFPYTTGDILPLFGTSGQYDLYFLSERSINKDYSIGLAKNTKTGEILAFVNATSGFTLRKVKGLETSKTEINTKCESCFKKELVYNGKTGSSLKFVYREYINDMARPAFNQDLQYDLNESNIIGIKGLRAEIINATNTKLQYKLLSNFSD